MAAVPAAESGRVARRRQQNLEALIAAGQQVMAEKGIDAATMQEIADRADVGAGTVYSYFKSKEELAIAVLERLMYSLALKIEKVTNTFDDPAQVYAFGIRTVIDTASAAFDEQEAVLFDRIPNGLVFGQTIFWTAASCVDIFA
jgi:AcrR family transcriptional regulator